MSPESNDPDEVVIEMRSAHPPYKTWREIGHLPFEFYGERFAVTRNVNALDSPYKFRVSHIATGIAIPQSDGETKIEAKAAGLAALAKVSEKKFKAALAKARVAIATGE